ncbi:MAG: DNA-processing protein DprA [Vampirovibrionales bacterium]
MMSQTQLPLLSMMNEGLYTPLTLSDTPLPWQVYRGVLFALGCVKHWGCQTIQRLIQTSWVTYQNPAWLLTATEHQLTQGLGKTKQGKTFQEGLTQWLAERPLTLLQADARLEAELTHTGSVYLTRDALPEPLHHLYDAPLALFVKGNTELVTQQVGGLAIVGTRHATPYGKEAVRWLCKGLKHQGVVIWSGGARGIDTYAHQEALNHQLPTVAVMGCGFDTLYPKTNKLLFESILEAGGAWVSEYPSFIPPEGFRFPQRNRLVASFSDATLVIEAPKKSGSLITARLALEQGKTVLALPGNVFDPNSEGPHYLLAQGAVPLTHPEELLHHVCSYKATLPEASLRDTTRVSPTSDTVQEASLEVQGSELQTWVWQQCHLTRPTHYDVLWHRLQQSLPQYGAGELTETLLLMELDGLLQSLPGDHYCRQALG